MGGHALNQRNKHQNDQGIETPLTHGFRQPTLLTKEGFHSLQLRTSPLGGRTIQPHPAAHLGAFIHNQCRTATATAITPSHLCKW
ncbi:hypothetical protein G6F64_015572 [Rhizopus arrhizus]|uniref:Uncharacterized protein n=1 Tax=Rhizopus oryzae TaxID=64495 RepID=A0A9P7BIH2_RHIOR|nr:hypothetical protein G6F64_015572 [Rhizopus arrhizus]